MKKPNALICTRLVDMVKMHPHQDNSRACNRCRQKVGIYPTGQRALRLYPKIEILCISCAVAEKNVEVVNVPAGTIEEIRQEFRESKPVVKQ